MIDTRRLEALVAVHRTGSVSAAAVLLSYGQPTISHHLRRLEAETGSVLVQRVGRGVRLTPDGVLLARRGEEILGLLSRADEELTASTSLRAGRVRLAAFPSAAATLVPDVVQRLAHRAPGLALELVEAEPPEAAVLLRSGQVDLAVTFGYEHQESVADDGIDHVPLFGDPLYLVTGGGRTGTGPVGTGSADLTAHRGSRWVTGCERCRSELLSLCAEAGFDPEIGFASDDYVAVQALVAVGFGVTILPGLALAAHQDPRVHALPLSGVQRVVSLSSYGRPPRPAAVDAVASALGSVARARH